MSETVAPQMVGEAVQSESWWARSRAFLQTRIGRVVMCSVATLGLTSAAQGLSEQPAVADQSFEFTVEGTGGDGVWLHGVAGFQGKEDLIKVIPEGTRIKADCLTYSDPVGELANPVWLHVEAEGTSGYMTDYFTSSRWNQGNTLEQQGLTVCGEQNVSENEESKPTYPDYDRRAVYFQPRRADLHDEQSTKSIPAVYTMVAERGKENSWTTEVQCGSANAKNFLNTNEGRNANTLVGFSLGRIGVIKALKEMTDTERANIDYVMLFDPGNKEDFTGSCDPTDSAVVLNKWLNMRQSNRLVVISGRRTGEDGHAGIQNKFFPVIKAFSNQDQVVVCNNAKMGHEETWNVYKYLIDEQPLMEPSDCTGRGWNP